MTDGPPPKPDPASPHPDALRGLTLAAVLGCALLLYPVLPGVTWGVTFAAAVSPVTRWLGRRLPYRALVAAIGTAVVVLAFLIPLGLVVGQLIQEARAVQAKTEEQVTSGAWRDRLRELPHAGPWLDQQLGDSTPEDLARSGLSRLGGLAMPVAMGSAAFTLQTLVALFVLFFCLKDSERLLAASRRLIPLPAGQAEHLLARADDAIQATLRGTFLSGVVHGLTGGLLFWALGLPAPVLWGVVITVVSILPILGAFIVWVPAAGYLAASGQYWQAAVLVGWGLLMAGPVGNWIYASNAGDRMQLHPAVTLLAFIGGLAVFGVSGMVLGPVLVVVATELLALWQRPSAAASLTTDH